MLMPPAFSTLVASAFGGLEFAMPEPMFETWIRRAEQEERLAIAATCPEAAYAHRELARRYRARAQALKPSPVNRSSVQID